MREFVDQIHPVEEEYYKVMDRFTGRNAPYIIPKLKRLIRLDPYYFEPYNSLVELMILVGKDSEAYNLINLASKRALKRIVDRNGKWPNLLKWSRIENRHIIMALLNRAIFYWDNEQPKKALGLFRKLLKSNPNDNIGARDFILAINMNMTFDQFEDRFNKGGYYDKDLIEWFDANYKKFPHEFEWWEKKRDL